MANIPAPQDAPSGPPSSNGVTQAPNSTQRRVGPASVSASGTAVQTPSTAIQTQGPAPSSVLQFPSTAVDTPSTAVQTPSTVAQTLSTAVQVQSTTNPIPNTPQDSISLPSISLSSTVTRTRKITRRSTQALFLPSTSPVYLPFPAQHRLLVYLQTLLEGICYKFGQREMPEVLKARRWDCAEAGELNLWVDEIDKFFMARGRCALEGRLHCISRIRHEAVHRSRVSTDSIKWSFMDVKSFVKLLKDTENTERISRLYEKVHGTMGELARKRWLAVRKLEETLRAISARGEEGVRLRQLARTEMEQEYTEYQALAGREVEEAITLANEPISTTADT